LAVAAAPAALPKLPAGRFRVGMDQLLCCAAPDPWIARRGRWLSVVLLSLIGIFTLWFIAGWLQPGAATANARIESAAVVVGLCVSYYVNRRGHVVAAATGLLGVYSLGVLGAMYFALLALPGAIMVPFLLLPVIFFAGIFLSWRVAGSIIAAQMVHAAWFYAYAPLPALVEYRTTHPGPLNWTAFTAPLLIALVAVAAWVGHRVVSEWNEYLEVVVITRTEELIAARAIAETASQAKSAFLANLSHELRTALNIILGYSEVILEDAADQANATLAGDAQRIQIAGNHLLTLINTLLDLSKIEAGKMTVYPELFAVPPFLDEIIAGTQALIEKNGNHLCVDYDPALTEMASDVTKVRQILFNLLSNAAKFTSAGTVTVRVQRLLVPGAAEAVRFEVHDTGIGITAEQMDRLFQEFVQADLHISRQYGGTGLGLVLSHRLAQLLGGDLTVTSRPGSGSTFTLQIPRILDGPQQKDSDVR